MTVGRRKVSAEEARVLVREWQGSGMAMRAWCAAQGIDGRSLRYWADRRPAGPELRVVEMSVPAQASSVSRIRLRVHGVTIVVGEDVTESALTRVLRAVRAC